MFTLRRSLLALFVYSLLVFLFPAILCAAGWKWQNPLPQGNRLNDVEVVSGATAVFVGGAGTILHRSGETWTAKFSTTSANLHGVWAGSETDIFAVGTDSLTKTGIILHYDGTSWQTQHTFTGSLHSIWGSSGSDVFAVGYEILGPEQIGVILHYDGENWSTQYSEAWISFNDIYGNSSSDIFAVGDEDERRGVIYHYDGTVWSKTFTAGIEQYFVGVWASSGSDVFAVGYEVDPDIQARGIVFHYDGESWATQYVTSSGASLTSVWGSSSSRVFASGFALDESSGIVLHYDGTEWDVDHETGNVTYQCVSGSSGSHVFAAGDGGAIAHYDGATWDDLNPGPFHEFTGAWGSSNSDVYGVGYNEQENMGYMVHFDGNDWTTQYSAPGMIFQDVWGASGSDIFVTAYDAADDTGKIFHYDGSEWTIQYTSTDSFNLVRLWGSSGSDVFAVGQDNDGLAGIICHYDGESWTVQYRTTDQFIFNSVWGTSGSDVLAVGVHTAGVGGLSEGHIFHYDGTEWSSQFSEQFITFVDIWGASPSDVFTVGHDDSSSKGVIFYFDGENWTKQYDTPQQMEEVYLVAIWGASDSDLFASGLRDGESFILHYDGQGWSPVAGARFSSFVWSLWGDSSSSVYAVGSAGAILHYDGNGLIEAGPEQAAGVSVEIQGNTARSISWRDLRDHYGTPKRFRPYGDTLEFTASVSPEDGVAAFRFQVSDVQASVSALILYKLLTDQNPRMFEYAASPGTLADGAWWITNLQGDYLSQYESVKKGKSYFVNFVVQDNGDGGYDRDPVPGRLLDPLVLGSDRGDGGGDNCFIATAAYGSRMEPQVQLLRTFRDRFLRTNAVGQAFLRFYYSYSPSAADFIGKHDGLRAAVRWCLLPCVGVSWMALHLGPGPTLAVVLLAILLITASATVVVRRIV
jgi:hypothetical protein